MKRIACGCFLVALLLVPGPSWSQEQDPASVVEILASVRDDLIQLRLEQALASLDGLFERSDLTRQERADAWVLRSRAHVAFGDLDAAMEDYREILNLRPGFRQESSLVTPDAEIRFNKLRAEMISTLRLDIQPADAVLIIDGEKILPSASGTVAVLAGSRRIRLEKRGFDALDEELDLPAGVEFGFQRQLFPNARDVVIRSWVPGVQVLVDGGEAGETARAGNGSEDYGDSQGGVLVIQDMSLGEHQFEFRLDCYLTQSLKRMVTVDIMEPTPLLLPRLEMERLQVPLVAKADFPQAEIFVDGDKVGDLQSELLFLCPGERDVEFRAGGRTVYSSRVNARDGEPVEIAATARPTVILAGADSWPAALEQAALRYSRAEMESTPLDRGVNDPERWDPDDFPADVDLVFAVLEKDDLGVGRMILYSPILDSFQEMTPERVDALSALRPVWMVPAPGVKLVDAPGGGGILVAAVRPGGPAGRAGLSPGARLLDLDGQAPAAVVDYEAALAGTAPGESRTLRFRTGDGEDDVLEVVVPSGDSPLVAGSAMRGQALPLMAAWARVDMAAYPDRSVSAQANLALALAEAGNFKAAVEAWKRVRWTDRPGIGEGTRAYYLGRVLDRLGREDEAVRAFRRAASTHATVFTDDGPGVAPAARDHLADLGVSSADLHE